MKRIVLIMMFGFVLCGCRYVNDAADTVFEETKLSSSLKKYEWFKDAASQCEAKLATINTYKARQKSLADAYIGKSRSEWSREDREQYNLWESELAGIRANYNNLAAQYNAAMSKINYAYTNVGELPRGASQPLPREFKPYLD